MTGFTMLGNNVIYRWVVSVCVL